MSRMCPGCKREIDDNARFCPFCATFTGEKKKEKKKSRVGSIIGGVSGAVVLGGIALAVLAFDAFGIFKNEPEHLTGTGDKLFNLSLSPAKSGDKWGYIDRSGKFVIKPQFDCAYPFDENINGTAAVSNENGYGFINDKGEFTIEPQFTLASYCSDNGLSVVTAKDGYMLYVDGKGRTAYDNKHFTYAEPFCDGADYTFAYTVMTQSVKDNNGKDANDITDEYYLLSSDGKTVNTLSDGMGIDCVFGQYYVGFAKDTDINEGSNDFTKRVYAVFTADGTQKSEWHDRIFVTDGFVLMCDTDSKSGIYKATVCDRELNKVSEEYYCDRNPDFTDGGLVLIRLENGRYRKVLAALKGSKLSEVYKESDGTAVVSGFDKSGIACIYEKGRYCGYTADGKIFESDYPFGGFNSGLAPFYDGKSGKIGYINTSGNTVVNAQYDGVSDFYADGYAYIYENGEYGIIDISGQTIAEKLDFAPTKLINSHANHNWYTPKAFDGAEYYENTVNFGTMKIRGSGEYVYREEDDTYFSDDSDKLIRTSDGREVIENSELIYNYGEVDDGYAVLSKDGYYLLDNKGNAIPVASDGFNNFCSMKCGDEYFYGAYKKSLNELVMSDVNKNTVTVSFSGNGQIENLGNGFAVAESDSENVHRSRYRIYTESLTKPFVMSTNDIVSFWGADANVIQMSVRYYGSVDSSYEIWSIIDSTTGECLISQKSENGQLSSLGRYFVVSQSTGLVTDVDDEQVIYMSSGNNTYYTAGGKLIGKFINAFACDDKLLAVDSDGNYKLYSRYGELLGEYGYACMNEKSQYIVVEKGGKYVCLDRRMNEVFESEYPFNPPVNNYAAYADINSGKIGYLDMSGKVAIPAFADFLSDFSTDGYARVTEDRDYISSKTATERLIDTNGKTVYDSSNFATQTRGFDHGKEYFKTLYCFDGGYRYYINYCKEHKDELTEYRNASYNIGLPVYGDTLSDLAGNVLYQFVTNANRIKYINSVKILDDGTPLIVVYYRIVVGANYSDYTDYYDPSIELRYYRLDGSEVKIEKHKNAESTVFVNGYFFESVLDAESKQRTLYVYDCDGKEKYSFTSPEYYVYLDAKAINGYVFTFRYYYNYDKYKEPDENAPIMAEVYDPNGKKLVECDNVYYSDVGFSENNNDEIRFSCYKENGMKEDRIYSLSQGKFVRTEKEAEDG